MTISQAYHCMKRVCSGRKIGAKHFEVVEREDVAASRLCERTYSTRESAMRYVRGFMNRFGRYSYFIPARGRLASPRQIVKYRFVVRASERRTGFKVAMRSDFVYVGKGG